MATIPTYYYPLHYHQTIETWEETSGLTVKIHRVAVSFFKETIFNLCKIGMNIGIFIRSLPTRLFEENVGPLSEKLDAISQDRIPQKYLISIENNTYDMRSLIVASLSQTKPLHDPYTQTPLTDEQLHPICKKIGVSSQQLQDIWNSPYPEPSPPISQNLTRRQASTNPQIKLQADLEFNQIIETHNEKINANKQEYRIQLFINLIQKYSLDQNIRKERKNFMNYFISCDAYKPPNPPKGIFAQLNFVHFLGVRC